MNAAIEIHGLRKVFGGVAALDGVDLTVPEGSIFGFLGPNGAGKTTTLRILTGQARPTGGTVTVLGADATRAGDDIRARMGYLPDVPGFYDWMTAREFLAFAGGLFGLSGTQLSGRMDVLLDLAGLTGVDSPIGGFSRGMKQRLGVAQALVNAPALLLLDEPTSALDPMGRKQVLDMLASLRGRTTVLFSTHVLADVERICDTVAILDHGKVVVEAPIDELRSRYGASRIIVELDESPERLLAAIRDRAWVSEAVAEGGTAVITVADEDAARHELPRIIVELGAGIRRMEAGEMGLEEVFVRIVEEGAGR
ncbi:MAG: ABC transporter ATP-binding protein [Coriobacteriia bacterium]|nr:ABC transporter ATP-binding protein [Coriobacteriia bacterium]